MVDVNKILNYTKNPDDDLYKILGCDPSATTEQILTEFKIRAKQYHPDKKPEDSSATLDFSKLQRAKEILCDTERRFLYDKWRSSGIAMDYQEWMDRHKSTHMATHWSNQKTQQMLDSQPAGDKRNDNSNDGTINEIWQSERTPIAEMFRNYQI